MLFSMVNIQDPGIWLSRFGLNRDETVTYLTLQRRPEASPLQLSRDTKINRTTLYRVLESLEEKGLIEKIIGYKSTRFQASPPDALRFLLARKQTEVSDLERMLPDIVGTLNQLREERSSPTKVLHFTGANGLRQLLYNTLSAVDEVVGYGCGNWNDGVGVRFAEVLRTEYVKKGIRSREILNDSVPADSYTKVNGYAGGVYANRTVSKSTLNITHDTYVYNGVFAFYHTAGGTAFGVEIHSDNIVRTQKQIFEILWKLAKPA